MITIRKSEDRGQADYGWLQARQSFSFADYYDPKHMHFRDIRVMNEDHIAPGKGFGTHPHDNMEIVTYVIDGALEHKDSTGNGSVIRRGDIQRMTAGSGITHSEFNASQTEEVHLIQIWILPSEKDLTPGYEEQRYADRQQPNELCLLASPDGVQESVIIHQDVRLYTCFLDSDKKVTHMLPPGRYAWVQLVSGQIDVQGTTLKAGDGAAVRDETHILINASEDAEFLLFDVR